MHNETRQLVIEAPNQPEQRHPWNAETIKKFSLPPFAVEILEGEEIYWDLDTAYSLEGD